MCDYGKSEKSNPTQINDNAWILDLEDIEKDTGRLINRTLKSDRDTTSIRNVFKKGDVLYSKLRTYLNKVIVADRQGYCTTEILPLDFNGFVVPEFARFVLMSNFFLEYTAECCYGVKMPRLGTHDGTNAPFPLPPINEQQQIVNVIAKLFNAIEEIDTSKESLEQYIIQTKSKVLELAIKGKLVPQNNNDEPASFLLDRIKNNKNSKLTTTDKSHYAHNLPRGWMLCKLGDVCLFKNGYAFKREDFTEEGVPLVRISNIKDNKIDLSTCKYIQSSIIDDKFTVKKGDLLIAMSGATTGKMGLYDLEEIAYLNQRVGNVRIVDLEVLLPEYRDYYMMAISSKILELAYGGAQPNISAQIIEAMALPLPPINEQKRIVSQIERIFAQLDIIENSLKA